MKFLQNLLGSLPQIFHFILEIESTYIPLMTIIYGVKEFIQQSFMS